jgi:hypothetical protein
MPEPIGFIILAQKRNEESSMKVKEVTINELKNIPGSWKITNLDRIIDGKLRLISETETHRHFVMSLKYKQWVVIAQSTVKTGGKFDIWQHKNGYVLALMCPSPFRKVIAGMLSLSIFGKLGGFGERRLEKEDFIAMQKYAIEKGGTVNLIHLRNVIIGNNIWRVYHVSGEGIERDPDEQKKILMAKKIKYMSFRFPRLGGSKFYFRVTDWGGGAIYYPQPFLTHHAVTLIDFFEKALRNK